MDRRTEYESILQELDGLEVPEGSVRRAENRRRRNAYLLRPLASVAAVFALFVLLVNVSAPVASACSRIPGLRELAAAVTFSRSLGDAVENNYVQPVDLTQTDGDVTVKVEYLIVDQKNVNVFYRIESDRYPKLEAEPEFRDADGGHLLPATWGSNDWDVPNGELRSLNLGFVDSDVPPSVRLHLRLREPDAVETAPEGESEEPELRYVAEFDFLLEFDPYYTAQGRHYAPDALLELDGQHMRLTRVDVYPSYLSLTLEGEPDNTAWLEALDFAIVTDRGERFERPAVGVISSGSAETPEMITYRADSTFFYQAERLTLTVTGAEWLDKDAEPVRVDLKNGTADRMAEGAELAETRREGNDWIVTVLKSQTTAQTFMQSYYDADGREYEINTWYSSTVGPNGSDAGEGMICESVRLRDYAYDEAWLTLRYTDLWQAANPVTVEIPLK